jgi:hypothetical protein
LSLTEKTDLTKGSEAKVPIDLDSGNVDAVMRICLSRSPPLTFDEAEPNVQALVGAPGFKGNDHVPLQHTGTSIL